MQAGGSSQNVSAAKGPQAQQDLNQIVSANSALLVFLMNDGGTK